MLTIFVIRPKSYFRKEGTKNTFNWYTICVQSAEICLISNNSYLYVEPAKAPAATGSKKKSAAKKAISITQDYFSAIKASSSKRRGAQSASAAEDVEDAEDRYAGLYNEENGGAVAGPTSTALTPAAAAAAKKGGRSSRTPAAPKIVPNHLGDEDDEVNIILEKVETAPRSKPKKAPPASQKKPKAAAVEDDMDDLEEWAGNVVESRSSRSNAVTPGVSKAATASSAGGKRKLRYLLKEFVHFSRVSSSISALATNLTILSACRKDRAEGSRLP
jgi:hypothetical protein